MPSRFAPSGPLALDPQAFGFTFAEPVNLEVSRRGNVALVPVRGPLSQHTDPWSDSYEALRSRVAAALDPRPAAVLLQVDTPGGVVAGAFETAAQIRAMCDASGVPLLAYVEGQAQSAGYALACAASHVMVSSTGIVGSIGVVHAILDVTAADEKAGVRYNLVASGARKVDNDPHVPVTEDVLAHAQANVYGMAEVFFGHVNAFRPGLSPDTLRGLQAGSFFGHGAVALGLADSVGSLEDAIAMAADARMAAAVPPSATEDPEMGAPIDDAIAALREIADGDNEEEAKRARAMLAAMDEDEEPEGSDEPSDEPEERAEDGEEDEPEGSAASAPAPAASASLEARVLAAEKRVLLAAVPNVTDALRDAVMAPDVSEATARKIIAAAPSAPRPKPIADVTPNVTRGAEQGGGFSGPTNHSPEASALDARLGLTGAPSGGVTRERFGVRFSTLTTADARKLAKSGA